MSVMQRRYPGWGRAVVTWAVVLVNVLWFAVVEGHRGGTITGLVQSGALDWPDVVTSGQWWRLVTAMFVHMNLTHLAVNMVSLGSLYIIELMMGKWMFLFAYLVSGICGNIFSLLISPHNEIAAGASGAIFGVFGVALYLSLRGILPKAVRNQLIVILILNLVFDFSRTNIGTVAHIGGLIAGVVVAAGLVQWPNLRTAPGIRLAAIVLIVVTVVALGLALPGHSPAVGR